MVYKSKCDNCSHDLKFTMNVPEEFKKVQEEKVKLTQTVQSLTTQSVSAKNIQANLVSDLKKKVDAMERSKAEMVTAMQSAATQHRVEMELLKKNSEEAMREELTKARRELEAANQTINAKATEIEALKSEAALKGEEKAKDKRIALQLKRIGRDETHKLLEERINTLETEMKKLKAKNVELEKTSTLKEERAKTVLKTARAKIQKSEDEKKKLELELEQIGQSRYCIVLVVKYLLNSLCFCCLCCL